MVDLGVDLGGYEGLLYARVVRHAVDPPRTSAGTLELVRDILELMVVRCIQRALEREEREMSKLKPLGDRVLVRRIDAETMSPGGIIIPGNAQEKPTRGVVMAVGPGALDRRTGARIPMSVKAGDEIIFGKYTGSEIRHEEQELLIVREDELFAVVEPELS